MQKVLYYSNLIKINIVNNNEKPQKVNKTKACVMVIMRENVLNCHNTNFAMQKKKKSLSTLCFLYANI